MNIGSFRRVEISALMPLRRLSWSIQTKVRRVYFARRPVHTADIERLRSSRVVYYALPWPVPSGGVNVLYEHVAILNRFGISACILTEEKGHAFRPSSLAVPISVMPLARALPLLEPHQAVVTAECWREPLEAFSGARAALYVFNQNQFNTFQGLGERDYRDLKVRDVFVSSVAVRDFLVRVMRQSPPPEVIPCMVDQTLFRPRPKQRQIAFMPRKMRAAADFVRRAFHHAAPAYRDIPWVEIDGMPREQVAEVLGASRWFVSFSDRESLGLPPLEAMASGCLVVGFHGQGGREFADSDNGFWVEGGDLVGCALAIAEAIRLADADPGRMAWMLTAATQTAARYSREATETALLKYWSSRLGLGLDTTSPGVVRRDGH